MSETRRRDGRLSPLTRFLTPTVLLVITGSVLLTSLPHAAASENTDTSGTLLFTRPRVWGPHPQEPGCCLSTDVYAIGADGSNERVVAADLGFSNSYFSPAWSPDGSRIAMSGYHGQTSDIFIMKRPKGSGGPTPRRLFESPASHDVRPTWSPDGKRLAYARWLWDEDTFESAIWTVGADGTGLRRVTRGPSPWEQSPSWSPDGRWIAFVRWDLEEPEAVGHVYVVRSDGKKLRRVTHGRLDAWRPQWSPDGKWLAFSGSTERTREGVKANDYGIYVVGAKGGEPRRLADSGIYETACWSPDGTRLAFSARVGGVEVWKRTPSLPFVGWWSIWAYEGTPSDLYSVNLDGSDLRRITFTPHLHEEDCHWSAT